MAASQASIAASRLLNLRTPVLHTLLRRHLLHPSGVLLHPSAVASLHPTSTSPTQSLNLFNLEYVTTDSPVNSSSARDRNFNVPNFPLSFQLPLGYPVMQIEAARGNNPSTPKVDDDDLEDDNDVFDDEVDDDDIEDFSGSEFDDEDEDDEDADARRPSRK